MEAGHPISGYLAEEEVVFTMREVVKIYGSLVVLLAFAISGSVALGMFINGAWILDRIGLVGLIIEIIVLNLCAVLSFLYDIPGNAKKAVEKHSG